MDSGGPLLKALLRMADSLPMHMPGHKRNPYWGSAASVFAETGVYDLDFTEVPGLDDLHAPEGVIAEAQDLAADCFKAKDTFFLINGATVGIAAAIMTCCREGDKVLVPRNGHRCVYEGLVLSGAVPVYFQPAYHSELGLPLSPSREPIVDLIRRENPKALVLVHPTYHGAGCDLGSIDVAHRHNLTVIVDESHGSHFCFDHRLPRSAVEAGADVVVHSTHKTLGSLTQTGLLHLATGRVEREQMAEVLSMLQSTSPSYLLMASLDAMRADLAEKGSEIVGHTVDLALNLRAAISNIPGFYCGDLSSPHGYDTTKILLQSSFMNGLELGKALRLDYKIYPELEEESFVLLMITVGDTQAGIERLITALRDISSKHGGEIKEKVTKSQSVHGAATFQPVSGESSPGQEIANLIAKQSPEVVLSPRQAFQFSKRKCKLEKAVGQISGSLVVPYPPGIPLLCPGERICPETVEYLYLIAGKKDHVQGLFRRGRDLELLVLEC